MRVVFVHGACVQDGNWWWAPTGAAVRRDGIASVAPALPSCGETGEAVSAAGPGLAEDAAAVREVLVGSDEPTVLVVHSYGGIVAAEALGLGAIPAVRHVLLISSYLPRAGESLATFGTPEPAPFLRIDPEAGTFSVKAEDLVDTFLHDCPEEIRAAGPAKLADQSLSVIEDPVGTAGFDGLATTYLICAADRGTSAERQRRYAERAGQVIEIDAGHHPFLAHPERVAEIVLELASAG